MNSSGLENLDLNNMTIENTHRLVKSALNLITTYKHILGNMGKSILSMLINDHEKFVVGVNEQSKFFYTEEIIFEEKNWDNRLNEIKKIIESCIKGDNEKKKIEAHNLDFFLTKHSHFNCAILFPQKYKNLEIFNHYHEDSQIQKSAKIIGVDKLFIELEAINAKFNMLHDLKIEENSDQLDKLVERERSAIINSYLLFCVYMQEAANLSSDFELHSVFNKMDDLHKNYATILSKEESFVSA
jgi:hypothetical protein